MTNVQSPGMEGVRERSDVPGKRIRAGRIVLALILFACYFEVPQEVLGGTSPASGTADAPLTISKVQPAVVQPDGEATLIFNKPVRPLSIKIGNKEATSKPQLADKTTVTVTPGPETPLGGQEVAVTVAPPEGKKRHAQMATSKDKEPAPASSTPKPALSPKQPLNVTGSIFVMPTVVGLKANEKPATPAQMCRGVIAGDEIIIQFDGPIPHGVTTPDLKVAVGDNKETTISDIQNDYLKVQVPGSFAEKARPPYPVRVSFLGAELRKQPKLTVVHRSYIYFWASLPMAVLILLIYFVYKVWYKPTPGQKRYSFLTMLLLEVDNQTYSLSRAQFLAWLIVIAWSYLYVYYTRGFVEQVWGFPLIGNGAYTFLISLGTLVTAQAAKKGMGSKGAGQINPSVSDLVVHGGVLALDRVQQVIWTAIAIGMFLQVSMTTAGAAGGLPDIPTELVALMGLSSASYLGGKLVRGAGPVIDQVSLGGGSIFLSVKGKHFSKDAFVWIDGVQQLKENVQVMADDPDDPKGFAKELKVTLALSEDDWYEKDHDMTVVNADAQRADWRTGPEIIHVTPGKVGPDGKVTLAIKGARLSGGAEIEVAGAPGAKPRRLDDKKPNDFSVEVDEAWLKTPHILIVTSNGEKGAYTYKPGAGV